MSKKFVIFFKYFFLQNDYFRGEQSNVWLLIMVRLIIICASSKQINVSKQERERELYNWSCREKYVIVNTMNVLQKYVLTFIMQKKNLSFLAKMIMILIIYSIWIIDSQPQSFLWQHKTLLWTIRFIVIIVGFSCVLVTYHHCTVSKISMVKSIYLCHNDLCEKNYYC